MLRSADTHTHTHRLGSCLKERRGRTHFHLSVRYFPVKYCGSLIKPTKGSVQVYCKPLLMQHRGSGNLLFISIWGTLVTTLLHLCCLLVTQQKTTLNQHFLFFFVVLFLQHFREHLDKLFAQGIGMLDVALTEAFSLLRDVSNRLTFADRIHHISAAWKKNAGMHHLPLTGIINREFSQSCANLVNTPLDESGH